MTDTVTRLMNLADDYADRPEFPETRQALEAELVRLFTPLKETQVEKFLRDDCIYTTEDMCGWSFEQGVKWAEQQHGIGGES